MAYWNEVLCHYQLVIDFICINDKDGLAEVCDLSKNDTFLEISSLLIKRDNCLRLRENKLLVILLSIFFCVYWFINVIQSVNLIYLLSVKNKNNYKHLKLLR